MRRELWVGSIVLATLLGACSDAPPNGAPVLGDNPSPPKASAKEQASVDVFIPDGLGDDTSTGCTTVECCLETLEIEASDCVTVEVSDGECVVANADDGTECDTESLCSQGACSAGECVESPIICESDNPCVESVCDTSTGQCTESSVADGTSCSDTPACVGAQICEKGECTSLPPAPCEIEGDQCNSVTCDDSLGCVKTSTPGENCNDDNPCTIDDTCTEAGTCTGTVVCDCEDDADCSGFSQPCDAKLSCVEGVCSPTTPPVDCDDGNECTVDKCDPVTGGCVYSNATALCDDGSACTTEDTCLEGVCLGTPVDCDDDDPCTTGEACDEETGQCIPGTGSCPECTDAGDCPAQLPCGGTWSCEEGSCEYDNSTAVDCNDIVVGSCQVALCDAATNTCVINELPDESECDDNDICTTNEQCNAGVCQPGAFVNCDDENECTEDVCNPTTGCNNTAQSGATCDDGSACTTGETCDDGVCKSAAPLVCDDGNQCTTDTCDPADGCKFEVTPDAGCDDGDACTTVDTCNAVGACLGSENTCECSTADDCAGKADPCLGTPVCVDGACGVDTSNAIVCQDSGNPCLPSVCSNGECNPSPTTGGECDDGSACTTGDSCAEGTCQGTALACDDGNTCTADSCDPAIGCVFEPQLGDCDDGNACTIGESCTASGECSGGTPLDCDDDNICTADTCSTVSGCKYSDAFGACNDGDACTKEDFCNDGDCVGQAVTCTGGDGVCLTAICNPESGACELNEQDCDDSNECTSDSCDVNTGCQNTDTVCNDNNACTTDSCDPTTGCVFTTVDCDDGLQCTNDACNLNTGDCESKPINCPLNTVCSVGTCTEALGCTYANPCDDSNPCTTDSCVENGAVAGCLSTPKDCDDGDACTVGTCVPETGDCEQSAKDCDDDDACTVDSCNESGCNYVPFCNDNDPCTVDTCENGECTTAVLCDDNDPCTADTCENGECSYTALDCDDGIACTLDECTNGECSSTVDNTLCDDDNPCTTDTCINTEGCQFTVDNSLSCDDGNECTDQDTCQNGTCVPGEVVCGPCLGKSEGDSCDDENADTVADICWKGTCAGFSTTISGTTSDAPESSFGKALRTADGFITIGQSGAEEPSASWLARIEGNTATIEAGTTLDSSLWVDITNNLVVATDGTALEYVNGAWVGGTWVTNAIQTLTFGEDIDVHAVYWAGEGPAYLAGLLDNAGFIARCTPAAGCVYEQINFNDADIEIPKALGAWPSGGSGIAVTMVTDIDANGGNFWNDAFLRNASGGWDFDLFDEVASNKRSRTVTGLSPNEAYWAGDNGLLLYRTQSGWSYKLDGIPNQSVTDFSQSWTGGGVVLLSACREHNSGKRTLYIVTHDLATQPSSSANWERHALYDQIPVECANEFTCFDPFGGFSQPASIEGVAASNDTIVLTGWRRNPATGARQPLLFVR